MEDIMDLPFVGQHEFDGEWGDDSLDLEGTMILVIQFARGALSLNGLTVKHSQVTDLVCWYLFTDCSLCTGVFSPVLTPSPFWLDCARCVSNMYKTLLVGLRRPATARLVAVG
jgi:hypothetical protein